MGEREGQVGYITRESVHRRTQHSLRRRRTCESARGARQLEGDDDGGKTLARRHPPSLSPSRPGSKHIAMAYFSSSTSSRRAWAVVASAWLIMLLDSATLAASADAGFPPPPRPSHAVPPRPAPRAALPPPRKSLRPPGNNSSGISGRNTMVARPARTDEGCAGAEDISIFQSRASVLPSGVPAYKVEVMNRCLGECAIADIHVRCGWFSSVELVDPAKFRRLRHNDCLLNNGRPMLAGETLAFHYANSFPYRLSVTVATCVEPTTVP